MSVLHDLGNRIASRRYALDLRQEDVAVLVGRTRSQIANIEAGRIDVPATLLVAIAKALRLSVGALLGEDVTR
jgi:transcriptional regulator with XRE-family HTH domain